MNGIVIILGNRNDEKGNLGNVALSRVNKAIKIWKKHPDYKILPTGGFGLHFNTTDKPHGDHVKNYLIQHGVPLDSILDTVVSSTTIEDAIGADLIIEKYNPNKILVVTSLSHIPRSWMIFRKRCKRKVRFIPALDPRIKGYFKEFQAVVKILLGIKKI